jgi:CRISPR type III-B/RAMP module-associated protein Cmr5
MKNLDQIRAENALKAAESTTFSGAEGGSIVKKIPTMIRENGLLGALAFACEKNNKGEFKSGDHHKVFEKIMEHLRDSRINLLPASAGHSADDFLSHAAEVSSAELRALTDESMAYLAFFRRFAS